MLWRRRYRLFGMLILAALVAQTLTSALNDLVVQHFGTPELLAAVHRPDWLKEAVSIGSISSTFVAGMVSTVVLGLAVDQPRLAPRRVDRWSSSP